MSYNNLMRFVKHSLDYEGFIKLIQFRVQFLVSSKQLTIEYCPLPLCSPPARGGERSTETQAQGLTLRSPAVRAE